MVQTYTFDKANVLETLRANRIEHRKIFLEALEGYRKTAIERFTENIENIKAGKLVSSVYLTLPTDQTKDYDRTIKLLELSEGDKVELTEEQFTNYMLDDWAWKRNFYASNASYSLSAATKLAEEDGADD